MESDNPYAAPQQPETEPAVDPEQHYLDWPLRRIMHGIFIVTLVSGICVLACQLAVPQRLTAVKAASFASVGISVAVVFGTRRLTSPSSLFVARLSFFSAALIVALVVWTIWFSNNPMASESMFYASIALGHILVPTAVCWVRGAPIRVLRALICGAIACAVWLGTAIVTIELFVEGLSQPYADYVGFTSLTVLWSICTSAATAVLMRVPPQPNINDD